jgi:hypothetical protein
MKNMTLITCFVILMWSCNNDSSNNTNTNSSYDSLETNPHAVPSHVDTITHEDGLSNQSQVPDTISIIKDSIPK